MGHTIKLGWQLGVLVALAWSMAFLPSAAHAQRDASLEALLENADLRGKAVDDSPIRRTTVSDVNRQVHWRLWKRVVATGVGAGNDELTALEHDGRSVGYVNQVTYGMAVAGIASSMTDTAKGFAMFEHAERLAVDMPYVYFAHAKYAFDRDPAAFHTWGTAWTSGLERALSWPDTRFPWALKYLLFGLFALAMGAFVFAFGQIIRQFGILAYDVAAILPRGFSSSQTVVLLLGLAVVPGLIYQSPLLGLVVLLALVSIPQQLRERLVSLIVFALLAALPQVDQLADDLAAYSGSNTQTMVHAQYIACDEPCREDLLGKLDHTPKDQYLLFTSLLADYRTGTLAGLDRVVEVASSTQWQSDIRPWVQNLAGVALLAQGHPDRAIISLKLAQPVMRHSGAPSFNLMRAYQMQDDIDQAAAALREATSRNLEQVSRFLRFERRDVNSFVIAEPLPLEKFWAYHRRLDRPKRSAVLPIWLALAGPKVPLDWSTYMGLGGLIVVLLSFPLSLRGKTSTPCPRCGMARDPRDSAKTGDHRFCLPCYRTFVTGAGLDYNARVHNETVLGRRERVNEVLRRTTSVILPGGGHHLAGHSVLGFLLTVMICLGAMMVAQPLGLVRPIHEIYSPNWGGTATMGWVLLSVGVLMALYSAARDVQPIHARGVR